MDMPIASQPPTAHGVAKDAAAAIAAIKMTDHLGALEAATTNIAPSAAFKTGSHTGVPVGAALDRAAPIADASAINAIAEVSAERDRTETRIGADIDMSGDHSPIPTTGISICPATPDVT